MEREWRSVDKNYNYTLVIDNINNTILKAPSLNSEGGCFSKFKISYNISERLTLKDYLIAIACSIEPKNKYRIFYNRKKVLYFKESYK